MLKSSKLSEQQAFSWPETVTFLLKLFSWLAAAAKSLSVL